MIQTSTEGEAKKMDVQATRWSLTCLLVCLLELANLVQSAHAHIHNILRLYSTMAG